MSIFCYQLKEVEVDWEIKHMEILRVPKSGTVVEPSVHFFFNHSLLCWRKFKNKLMAGGLKNPKLNLLSSFLYLDIKQKQSGKEMLLSTYFFFLCTSLFLFYFIHLIEFYAFYFISFLFLVHSMPYDCVVLMVDDTWKWIDGFGMNKNI